MGGANENAEAERSNVNKDKTDNVESMDNLVTIVPMGMIGMSESESEDDDDDEYSTRSSSPTTSESASADQGERASSTDRASSSTSSPGAALLGMTLRQQLSQPPVADVAKTAASSFGQAVLSHMLKKISPSDGSLASIQALQKSTIESVKSVEVKTEPGSDTDSPVPRPVMLLVGHDGQPVKFTVAPTGTGAPPVLLAPASSRTQVSTVSSTGTTLVPIRPKPAVPTQKAPISAPPVVVAPAAPSPKAGADGLVSTMPQASIKPPLPVQQIDAERLNTLPLHFVGESVGLKRRRRKPLGTDPPNVTSRGSIYSKKCVPCDLIFFSKDDYKSHMKNLHKDQFEFWCEECNFGHNDPRCIEEHKARHEGRDYPCPFCHKRFKSLSGFKRHQSDHTGSYAYVCSICGHGENIRKQFEIHQNRHFGNGYACGKCKKLFYHERDYMRHYNKCIGMWEDVGAIHKNAALPSKPAVSGIKPVSAPLVKPVKSLAETLGLKRPVQKQPVVNKPATRFVQGVKPGQSVHVDLTDSPEGSRSNSPVGEVKIEVRMPSASGVKTETSIKAEPNTE